MELIFSKFLLTGIKTKIIKNVNVIEEILKMERQPFSMASSLDTIEVGVLS